MKKILAAAVMTVVLLAACGGAASDEAQIKASFDKLANAMKSGDYDQVKDALGDQAPSKEEFNMMSGFFKEMEFEISEIEVDGDTATAQITVKGNIMGQELNETNEAQFVKVDGRWLPKEMVGAGAQ